MNFEQALLLFRIKQWREYRKFYTDEMLGETKLEAGVGPLLASHGITAVIAAAVWNRGRVVS